VRVSRSVSALAVTGALLATFVAAPAAVAAPADESVPPILVTEILADTVGADQFEYIEVHNTTDAALDLAASGISFAYSYVDTDNRAQDIALQVDGPLVLAAGETAVLWLSYTSKSVDSFSRSVDDFRAYYGMGPETQVARITGQAGMANGGDRGIRVVQDGALISWSHYPAGSVGEDLAVNFRLPADATDLGLEVLAQQAQPSPGAVQAEALVRPTPDPEPDPDPEPGAAANWPLIVTEIAPDHTGSDNYEFFEVYNTTGEAIDLDAAGYTFDYTKADSSDLTGDVVLDVAEPTTIGAGEAVVFWLSYTSESVDSFSKSVDQFRAQWAVPAATRVVRVTGQPGMANGGNRGIRVLHGDDIVSWSFYPAGSVAANQTANFRIPADSADLSMELLAGPAAATPGAIAPEALVAPEPEPEPGFDPQPDPTVVTAPLQITEVLPDSSTNLDGSDAFEFVEIYNATSSAIDFSDYSINYVYPGEGTTEETSSLWPAVPANVVIPGGETLVFWIKNGPNSALGEAEFNAAFGTSLKLGEDLVEISSGGMANGSARGLEIVTNTGHSVSRAMYNMNLPTDDVLPDQGIRYTGTDDLGVQRLLDLAPATPGTVQQDQVPGGLMIVPADAEAPVVGDRTAVAIDPAADFPLTFAITDDVLPRTVTLVLSNDVDPAPVTLNLLDGGDGIYSSVIDAVDLTGKSWYEYTLTASDGTNTTTLPAKRVEVAGVDDSPVRLNLEEGQFVSGVTEIIAAGDEDPSDLELSIDGSAVETEPSLERAPVFAFEVTGVNYYFKNGVKVGDDVLRIFDNTINDWETLATAVPLSHVHQNEDELVVSVWAGTKKAPEIDEGENNDDFDIRNLRLILPDGRTLTPVGYDDPSTVLRMGDSAGKYNYYDARFALPADAYSAVLSEWDTAAREDGPVEIAATDDGGSVARTVVVDNTAPVVTSTVVDGTAYQGEITLDAEATDAGSGMASTVATLDGEPITLPYATSSVTLPAGDHRLEVTATDQLGNVATWSATFVTYEEQPTGGILSPAEGAEVEAGDVTLQAKVEDPTGDVLDVAFLEGRRLDLAEGDIATSTGTVNDALDTQREEPQVLSGDDVAALAAAEGLDADVASDSEFPYQLFDIEVGDDATGAQVRATWAGRANADATVLLYAMRADGSGWDEVARHVTTTDDEQFTLAGTIDADAYAVDGRVRMLVQHSEGFAGENLSSRDTAVTPNNPADVARSDYDFTFGWESDTQYYNENMPPEENRYRHQQAIHSYFLDQREELNLQYVFHTGDIVDDWDQEYQWRDNADPEYQRLDDAGLPYGVLAGNHDVGHELGDYTDYGTWFGEDRFADNPWYGGSYENNRGHYDLISAGGIDFIMVYQGWGPGDEEIAWMNEVLAQYPDRVAIIAQHEFILTTGGLGEIPQRIMDEVVATNPNVKMVFSGHYHDALTRTDGFDDDGDGVNERTVYSMLFDYQGLPEGGLGYLRLLHFDNEGERMLVRTYSPSLDDYNSDEANLLGPAENPNANQEFELTYDQLGIEPAVRTLGTDAFTAEVLSANEIASFEDVPSGSVLTATWPLAELGEHGWYVRTSDPYGAVDYSPVSQFTVIAAAVDPGTEEPGTDPGTGQPGTGQPGTDPGAGGPGAGSGGTPAGAGSEGDPANGGDPAGSTGAAEGELAGTGSDAMVWMPWTLAAFGALLVGAALILTRRKGGTQRG
jgi:hypothetical protein